MYIDIMFKAMDKRSIIENKYTLLKYNCQVYFIFFKIKWGSCI